MDNTTACTCTFENFSCGSSSNGTTRKVNNDNSSVIGGCGH